MEVREWGDVKEGGGTRKGEGCGLKVRGRWGSGDGVKVRQGEGEAE